MKLTRRNLQKTGHRLRGMGADVDREPTKRIALDQSFRITHEAAQRVNDGVE